ncbi:MAG: urease accessory protein UreD [Firmicutes bacterium]|nr:urease accessory protein UreD [Bacillota bacterium]
MTAYRGDIAIVVSGKAAASRVTRMSSQGSWRLLQPVVREQEDDPLRLQIIGQTPGLREADRQTLTCRVDSGAWLILGPSAAEIALPSQHTASVQRVTLTAEEASVLWWQAAPFIPYAGSKMRQFFRIWVQKTSRVAVENFLLAGRLARQERFAQIFLRHNMHLIVGGKVRRRDVWEITDAMSPNRWGQRDAYWSCMIYGPHAAKWLEAWPDDLDRSDLWIGRVALASDEVMIRALGSDAALMQWLGPLRRYLADFLWNSKESGQDGPNLVDAKTNR